MTEMVIGMTLFGALGKLRAALQRYRFDQGGNVILTFTLALIPIMGAVGAAVDYSRANSDKAAMQAALDATALMLSKTASTLTTSQIDTNATNYFNALFNRKDVTNIAVTSSYTSSGGSQILLNATGTVPTTIIKIMGMSNMTINASSTVKWGNSRLRVALVLDNTGSMAQYGKLSALKNATTKLLSQLQSAATQTGDVYVSIIPFVKDVNVDPVKYSQTWVDWGQPASNPTSGWEAEPRILNPAVSGSKPSSWYTTGAGSSCPFSNSNQGFQCTNGPATSGASTVSTIPSSGNYKGLICPSLDSGSKKPLMTSVYYNGCYNSWTKCVGSACLCTSTNTSQCSCTGSGASKTCKTGSGYTEHTWRPTTTNATYTPALVLDGSGVPYATTAHSTWNGCVTDRGGSTAPSSSNYDTNATAPSTSITDTLYAAEQYDLCPDAAVKALSYDWPSMTTLVNSMTANGNTNQAIGLQLGWMSLVGGGPFPTPPAQDPNYKYSQVIILLTDGLNTADRWYTSQSSIDARQQLTCNNINAAGITLYTVQVNTDGDPTSTLLQNCAGSPGTYPDSKKFFLLTSATQIVTTFEQIGTALSNLYVAK
jgi:Flp pilus assembly protein TadG